MRRKPVLIFDASLMANVFFRGGGTGIFYVSVNLLRKFYEEKKFQIYLYCRPEYTAYLRTAVKKLFPGEKFAFYERRYGERFSYYKSLWKNKKENCRESGNAFGKISFHFMASAAGSLARAAAVLNKCCGGKVKGADVFFSPAFAAPQEIAADKRIKKFIMLYDAIPLVLPGYERHMSGWFGELVNAFNGEDTYFPISDYTQKVFLEHFPLVRREQMKRVYISANGADNINPGQKEILKVKDKYNIPPGKKYFFSLGQFEARKNLSFTVRSFLSFIEKNNINDLLLALGGPGQSGAAGNFKSLPGWDKHKDKIIFTGYLDDEDVPSVYLGAEAFLLSSLYEGFGMPVLEAMKYGCPVICSDATSLPEVIGDCGITINPHDVQEMVAAMEKMYYDKAFRKECVKKGKARAASFSWEKTASEMTGEIMRRLAAGN